MKPLPDPALPWHVPHEAVRLIADAEGLRLRAYRCPAGVWTCGWGETDGVTARTTMTRDEADRRLCSAIDEYATQVRTLCCAEPGANELGAMVSLAYNIGLGAFARSSVLRAHNRSDAQSASRAFGLWNQATVEGVRKPLAGLTARRAAEAALYLTPDDGAPSLRMPQAVMSVGRLPSSPTMLTGTMAVATGAVSVFAEAGQHIGAMGGMAASARTLVVETLGIPQGAVLPALLLLVGGIVVWRRWGQRLKGWA